MKTQISQHSFKKDKRYSGVYQQQGRMITDADWNELVEIIKARLYESLGDAVASGSPRDGGLVDFSDPQIPKLNWGKVFVNGVPAEVQPDLTQFTEAAPPTALLEYDKQQDFPDAPALPDDGNYVLYLDLWERPVIFLEDPQLRDPGLHGADTCTRTQTMAQVKWCPPPADSSQPPDCLNTNLNPPKGSAIFQLAQRSDAGLIDPCNPDAEAVTLDQGAGNYLFRLEVHDVKGPADQPTQITLKWSAENGAEQHAVGSEPPDFKQGNWIYEFYNDTGEKHLGVHLVTDLSFINRQNLITGGYPSVSPDNYLHVRRWDGYCILTYNDVFIPPDNNGSWTLTEGKAGIPLTLLASDVDEANAGQAKIRINSTTISVFLDTLVFNLQTDAKQFVAGDYWLGLIRENTDAGERVKVLSPEPVGITHYYLKLASYIAGTIQLPTNEEQRQLSFPPLSNLTADRIGYDASLKPERWEDINELPGGIPLTVQQAIDDLVDNLESSDIRYTLPKDCDNNAYEARTLNSYLQEILGTNSVKIKDAWDALLCHLDAKKLPYDPTVKPERWEDINETAADKPETVQDAIDNLVDNLESGDIGYTVPDCLPTTEGVPLFKELLGASGDTTLKQLWDTVLCRLDAEKLPYIPDHKKRPWQDVFNLTEGSSFGGAHIWSQCFGVLNSDIFEAGIHGMGIATDSAGNVLVTGYFSGTTDLGGGDLTSAGEIDLFVLKLGPDGSHHWSQSFGGVSNELSKDIAVDSAGNVLVTGHFSGTINFGGGDLISVGSADLFVLKLGPDGSHQWSQCFGGVSYDVGSVIAADGMGNALITGYFSGTVDFGGGNLTSVGSKDLFVLKLGPDGTHRWSQCFGGVSSDVGDGIAADGMGNVLITGYFSGTVDFGGGDLTSVGSNDLFVLKLGLDGVHQWSQNFGGVGYEYSTDIAVDGAGNVLVTGYFSGTIDFGGGDLTSTGSQDLFVLKLGPDGSHHWSQRFGRAVGPTGPSAVQGRGIAVDGAGNVLVTGYFSFTVNFGGDDLSSDDEKDLFVLKLGPDGTHQWSRSFKSYYEDFACGIAVDGTGNVLFTGYFSGTINFGGADFTSNGYDLFVVKLRGGYTLPATIQSAVDNLVQLASKAAIPTPTGSVIAFSAETSPMGWLECNGWAISRTEYQALFEVIDIRYGAGDGLTTFNLPDLRGEFIRGWDHGRGIDNTRGLGQLQFDQMQGHKHHDYGHRHWDLGHNHPTFHGNHHWPGGVGAELTLANWGNWGGNHTSYAYIWYGYASLTNPVYSGYGNPRYGMETRSRNIALMYCIKY